MSRFRHVIAAALPLAAFGFAAAPLAAQDAQTEVEAERPLTAGEERLAKLLDGREAGEPVRCIRTVPNQRMTTIDGTAYVYGSGNTIYVQRTRNPDSINANDALVTNRFSASQLCRLDQMTTVDRVLGVFTGAVFFEDFVPYTRVRPKTAGEG